MYLLLIWSVTSIPASEFPEKEPNVPATALPPHLIIPPLTSYAAVLRVLNTLYLKVVVFITLETVNTPS